MPNCHNYTVNQYNCPRSKLMKFCQTSIIILEKDELFSWITQFLVPFSTFRGCPCLSARGGWDGAVLVWRVTHSLHIMIKVHIFSHYVHLVLLENMLLFPAKINRPLHFDMKPYSFHQSLVQIGPVASEELIKMWKVNGRTDAQWWQ
jgi:hypothetical protein